jgi:asparagine synthase (glutamine-hydrolysing)
MEALRTAVKRRMVADVPEGDLLSGGIDSSIVVALLAEQGQRGLATFSIGFDSVGGEPGDEYFYSDLVAKTFSLIITASTSTVPGCCLPCRRRSLMSGPMVSHDCVAFFSSPKRSTSRSGGAVRSGCRRDPGYSWYPPLANVAREHATEAYSKVFFDRGHDDVLDILASEYAVVEEDPSLEFVKAHQGRRGAETAVDAALRLDTQVMLVDDPVKRVDTMTMAWGLEARVPFLDHDFVELAAACPAELKLASGGKGVLKDASRALLPAEGALLPARRIVVRSFPGRPCTPGVSGSFIP